MNVTLSKRGSYAAAAAICLARAYPSGRPKKLREISAEMDIPRAFAAQILGDLVHAGIAVSAFGRDGGHRLARPPANVSVAEVIEAAEGPLASERCALGDGPCRWQDVCPLHDTMTRATASLRHALASTSLAVLAERDAAIAVGAYPIPADAHRHAPAVTIADSVQVELPAAVVAARLSAGTSWLTTHAEACDEEEARIRVGPGSPGWLGKTIAVHLGEPADVEGMLVIPFIWESAGPAGIFPRFEGEMRLIALDPDRSEFCLSGRYRPPAGRPGQVLNDALLTRIAKATVRSFLRRTARGLEQEHASADPTRAGARQ
ncbi:MAG TPA: Rrf2 family transcriptional regulator [Streptosporangiaceae bacterium]|nr:Rrf2 family transcriptional regulator [Streptosporangiaceae bacterium]